MKAICAFFLLLLCTCQAHPYDLNEQTMQAAVDDAVRLSVYGRQVSRKAQLLVRAVPSGTVAAAGGCATCGPQMMFGPSPEDPRIQYIFVEIGVFSLPQVDGHALLVHELVHVLQFNSGAEWRGCQAEREATDVQNLVLRERALPPVPIRPECEGEIEA